MLGNNFSSRVDGNTITVKNLTKKMMSNCLIHVRNVFTNSVVFEITDFGPMESKTFHFITDTFISEWIDEKLYVSIYCDHELVYSKQVNDKTKCFVLYSNKNFESLTEQLIIGLNTYSTVDVLHYTINYSSTLDYPNLKNIRYDIDGDVADGQYMQFMKPKVFLETLARNYKSAVFLDADIQVRPNINDLFNYVSEIESAPIFQKAKWDYTTVNGQYIPGPLLTSHMNLPKQKYPHGVTNLVIFDRRHEELFKEWERLCFSDGINEIRKKEFLHDELILNCLQWKLDMKPKQFNFFVNVLSIDDVEFFYSHKIDYIESLNMNDFGLGHSFQSFIPYDTHIVKGFHCVKNPITALEINKYIYNKEIIQE